LHPFHPREIATETRGHGGRTEGTIPLSVRSPCLRASVVHFRHSWRVNPLGIFTASRHASRPRATSRRPPTCGGGGACAPRGRPCASPPSGPVPCAGPRGPPSTRLPPRPATTPSSSCCRG